MKRAREKTREREVLTGPGVGHLRSKWHMVEQPKKGRGGYRRRDKHSKQGWESEAGGSLLRYRPARAYFFPILATRE